jgi:hypothetical protein
MARGHSFKEVGTMEPADAKAGTSLWAWVTETRDGVSTIGVVRNGIHLPLITRDRDLIEKGRRVAQSHRAQTGQRCWLREYTTIVDHEDA